MSRTYRKVVKCGVCTGSNTEYYRDMNRKCRQKNNQSLRNLLANYDIDDVNDKVMTHTPIHNSWDEPTDGTFLISKTAKKDYTEEPIWRSDETGIHYWNRRFGKYLKPKHNKYYKNND